MTKSKRISLVALISAAALGGVCAYYRVQMARYGSRLPFGGMGYSPGFLFAAIAVCVLAFVLMSALYELPENEPGPAGVFTKIFLAISGLGFVGAAALSFPQTNAGAAALINVLFALVCGVALLIRAAKGETSASSGMLSLFPVYFLCFFLLRFYRENASNPSVFSFCIELAAVISVTLAAYAISSVKFEQTRGKPRFFLCLAAVYFAALESVSVALMPSTALSVPGISLGSVVILLSAGIYAGAGLFLQPAAGFAKPSGKKNARGAEPEGDLSAEQQLTARQIIADELGARATETSDGGESPGDTGSPCDTGIS